MSKTAGDEKCPGEGGKVESLLSGATPDVPLVPAGSVDNTVLLDAVQSLSQALSEYSARVSNIEERLGSLACSAEVRESREVVVPAGLGSPAPGGAPEPADHLENPCAGCTPAASRSLSGHPVAKPGDFDGSGSWATFIAQLQVLAMAQQWTRKDMLAALVAALKGPALEVFARLPEAEQTDFARLKEAMDSRFGMANREPWFRSQLRRRKRGPGEALHHLAHEIEQLVFMAYPTASVRLRDSLACDYFMDALDDPDLHIAVRQSRPSSLPEALTSAVEIEAIRSTAGVSGQISGRQVQASQEAHGVQTSTASGKPSTEEVLRNILRALNDLQKSVADSNRSGSGGRSGGPSASPATRQGCWECGAAGHFRRQCPRIRTRGSVGSNEEQGNDQ